MISARRGVGRPGDGGIGRSARALMIHCLLAAKLPQSAARPGSIRVVGPGWWGAVAWPCRGRHLASWEEMMRDTWTKTDYPRRALGLGLGAVLALALGAGTGDP